MLQTGCLKTTTALEPDFCCAPSEASWGDPVFAPSSFWELQAVLLESAIPQNVKASKVLKRYAPCRLQAPKGESLGGMEVGKKQKYKCRKGEKVWIRADGYACE